MSRDSVEPWYLPDGVLPLVEKFYSVQGEGANAGCAAIFIRFAGCNLDCIFADGSVCDTPWQKTQEKLTIAELLIWLDSVVSSTEDQYRILDENGDPRFVYEFDDVRGGCEPIDYVSLPIIILTGGEPTIARRFDDLVWVLKQLGFYVAVESNGTNYRESLTAVDWLVVSPKYDVGHGPRIAAPPGPHTSVLALASELRWVVAGRSAGVPDRDWMQCLAEDCTWFVSPALVADGSGTEHLRTLYIPQFADGAVERCMEIVAHDPRWRLSLQTHKWIRAR